MPRSGHVLLGGFRIIGGRSMAHAVGLDVSQKTTAICVVDTNGARLWRGVCASNPDQIEASVRRHAGDDAKVGVETGAMTPWLVHELRERGLHVICLDARHARAALEMQINKSHQNDAEGHAHIVRTDWLPHSLAYDSPARPRDRSDRYCRHVRSDRYRDKAARPDPGWDSKDLGVLPSRRSTR